MLNYSLERERIYELEGIREYLDDIRVSNIHEIFDEILRMALKRQEVSMTQYLLDQDILEAYPQYRPVSDASAIPYLDPVIPFEFGDIPDRYSASLKTTWKTVERMCQESVRYLASIASDPPEVVRTSQKISIDVPMNDGEHVRRIEIDQDESRITISDAYLLRMSLYQDIGRNLVGSLHNLYTGSLNDSIYQFCNNSTKIDNVVELIPHTHPLITQMNSDRDNVLDIYRAPSDYMDENREFIAQIQSMMEGFKRVRFFTWSNAAIDPEYTSLLIDNEYLEDVAYYTGRGGRSYSRSVENHIMVFSLTSPDMSPVPVFR